ncbi:hypothetical protein N7448_008807 [Penicillium atrosanguineum]|uniref:AA1-like domain-containing protein n=1 Tax=Penicillium atrosanguineum TaxID=1132637 RepID=A0A9W9UBD6_9EURO|nr:hypothetical protein N7448_008807 [Penicillium atrosanguineum]KAJ5330377.1 hypothetical protein N7476_000160 [Penicillium atrosanguineum]
MKWTITSILLAASSTLAAPTNVARSNSIQISDFSARAASPASTASMHFVVTDANYPDDTPTDCNLIWTYEQLPKSNARCNNGEYYIRFPQGAPDFNRFTLELERVSGPIPEQGQILLSSNANGEAPGTKWICVNNPDPNVEISCSYDGVLELQV